MWNAGYLFIIVSRRPQDFACTCVHCLYRIMHECACIPDHHCLSYSLNNLTGQSGSGWILDWWVIVYASPDTSIQTRQTDTQTQRQVYRMILARCILSLAGYGPWERKAFLTVRPAHGKLWEQDWNTHTQDHIKINAFFCKIWTLQITKTFSQHCFGHEQECQELVWLQAAVIDQLTRTARFLSPWGINTLCHNPAIDTMVNQTVFQLSCLHGMLVLFHSYSYLHATEDSPLDDWWGSIHIMLYISSSVNSTSKSLIKSKSKI